MASPWDMPKPRFHALHAASLVKSGQTGQPHLPFLFFLCRGMFVYVCAEVDMYAHMAVHMCKPHV